ncbi:MAG: flagellar hook protein FlgE [Motilibacteraceae bacterium]
MLRSLFSGISGLRQHQTMMDVTGNNIANVNTVGFKSSQTVFEDTLSQLLKGAGAPQAGLGGTNPAQVGLGVRLAGVNTNFGQGAAQTTGRTTDLMIQGDGFFTVRQGAEDLYTRAGAFNFDSDGRLVSPEGAVVQGWTAANGVINTNAAAGDVRLPIGTLLAPTPTQNGAVGGNLPAGATSPIVSSITVYDPQGNSHDLSYQFTPPVAPATDWSLATSLDGGAFSAGTALAFDSAGKLTTASPSAVTVPWGSVSLDISGLSNYGGANTVAALSQDGSSMGSLQAFSLSPDGTLVGVFSNGLKQPLAQIALASFNNPPGLEKVGSSMYRNTVNSGTAQLGTAGSGGRGLLSSGTLEMSNVDLAQEFTNLIVAQRGFQANSRVITASDEILQDLVNMKR